MYERIGNVIDASPAQNAERGRANLERAFVDKNPPGSNAQNKGFSLKMPDDSGQPGIKDFAFCGILGEGEFGRVMMARNASTQEIVAVKVPLICPLICCTERVTTWPAANMAELSGSRRMQT